MRLLFITTYRKPRGAKIGSCNSKILRIAQNEANHRGFGYPRLKIHQAILDQEEPDFGRYKYKLLVAYSIRNTKRKKDKKKSNGRKR